MSEPILDNYNSPESFDPNPPKPAAPIGKAVLYNFIFTLICFGIVSINNEEMAILGICLILLQIALNFLLGLILVFTKHRGLGVAMLMSSLAVSVLGFGTCLAML